MSWHSLNLGNGADAFGPTTEIQEAFLAWFAAQGAPQEAAVFSRLEPRDATVTLYFSPGASQFAQAIHGAAPCEKPANNRMSLLVGDQRALSRFFPRDGA